MKKVISMLLSVFMIMSAFSMVAQAESTWGETGGENVTFKFGVMSDTHSISTNELDQSLQAGLDLGAQFFAFTGDVIKVPTHLTDEGTLEFYYQYYDSIQSSLDKLTAAEIDYAAVMGNHEMAVYGTNVEIAQQAFVDRMNVPLYSHTVSDQGFHFISAPPMNYNLDLSDEAVEFYMTEIENAIAQDSSNDVDGVFSEGVVPNSTKPVFLLIHNHYKLNSTLTSYLKTRPQVIVLSGHMHWLAEDPKTIKQDGYTTYVAPLGDDTTTVDAYPKVFDPRQSTFVEVENDTVVKIYRLDLQGKTFIGEPWTIDISAIVSDLSDDNPDNDLDNYLYSSDKRTNISLPYFAEDAEFEADITSGTANFTFPKGINDGTPNQQDDYIFQYNVYVDHAMGECVHSEYIHPEFINNSVPAESYSFTAAALESGEAYTASVYPISPLNISKSSQLHGIPLTKSFITPSEEYPNGGTYYEFENNISATINEDDVLVSENENAYGGKLVNAAITGGNDLTAKYTDEFKIKAESTGTYTIKTAMGRTLSDNSSVVNVYIDDELIATNDSNYAEDISLENTYPSAETPMSLYEFEGLKLSKGEHTVRVEALATNSSTDVANYLFSLDYLAMYKTVSDMYFEAEDYQDVKVYTSSDSAILSNTVAEDASFNGGKYVNTTLTDASYLKAEIEIPYTIEETGTYYLSFKTIAQNDDKVLNPKLYLDGTEIFAVPKTDYNGELWCEWEIPVEFSNNSGIITFSGEKSSTTDNLYMWWDYLKFSDTPKAVNRANVSGTTVVEAENYTVSGELSGVSYPVATEIVNDSEYSGGGYIKTTPQETGITEYIEFPITVETPGVYTITPKLFDEEGYTAYTLYLDGSSISTLSTATDNLGWFETSVNSYISKGEHTIKIASTGDSNKHKMTVDCLTISPFVVSADGATIEVESFKYGTLTYLDGSKTDVALTAKTDERCETGRGVLVGYSKATAKDTFDYLDIEIPVHIKEAGYYDVDFNVSPGSEYSCFTTLYIDGVAVKRTRNNGSSATLETESTVLSRKYFDAGDALLTLRLSAPGTYGAFQAMLDYVKFTPSSDITLTGELQTVEFESIYSTIFNSQISGSTDILTNKTDCGLSNNGLMYFNNKSDYSYSYIVNAPEVGQYTFKLVSSAVNSSYTVDVILGETTVIATDTSSKTNNGAAYGGVSLYEYEVVIDLEKGNNTITFAISRLGSQPIYLDYMSFETYVPPADLDLTGELQTVEFESIYNTIFNTQNSGSVGRLVNKTGNGLSNDGLMYSNKTGEYTYTYIVKAPEKGQYKLSLGATNHASTATFDVILGDETVITTDGSSKTSYGASYGGATLYKYEAVLDLEKGNNTITFVISRSASNKVVYLDYMSFETYIPPADLNLTGLKQTVEFESVYSTIFNSQIADSTGRVVNKTGYNLSNNGLMYFNSKGDYSYTYIVSAPEAGKYLFKIVASDVNDSYTVDIILGDETVIATNTSAKVDNGANYVGVNLYEYEAVLDLAEGNNTITFAVSRLASQPIYLDFMSFETYENVTYDAETEIASAVANVETAGEVIIALYDTDGKVCGIYTETVTEAKTVKATEIICTKAPVSCKVFVWEDLVNVKPLIDVKTITVE